MNSGPRVFIGDDVRESQKLTGGESLIGPDEPCFPRGAVVTSRFSHGWASWSAC